MEEASENGNKSSHSACANGMNELNEYLMCHNGTPPRGTVLRDGLTQEWKVPEVPTGDSKPYNVHEDRKA
jgi:hypothetical protein